MLIHTPKNLARYYRDQRRLRNISQTQIAEEVATRQDTVSKFENKPENVRIDTLFRLLSALELELHVYPKGESIQDNDNKNGWTEKW